MNLSDWISFENRAFRASFFLYALVGLLGFILVVTNAKLLSPFFLLVGIALYLVDKKMLLVVLYLVYLPTNGLINRDDFLFGVLGIQQILGVLTVISLFSIKSQVALSEFQKVASRLILVLIAYASYTFFKNAVFGLMDSNMLDAAKKIINVFLLFGPLILVLHKCSSNSFKGWVAISLFLGTLNQAIFCFLSPFLPNLGFYSQGTDAFFISTKTENISRFVGVMGNGDSNSLGAFFVISIGFFLSRSRAFNQSLLIKVLCALCVVAIALTNSRTAFLSLSIIGMLFLAKSGSGKVKLQFLVGVVLLAIATLPLWETLLDRLSGAGSEQLNTDTSSNRIGKWLLYFNHFFSHPTTFIHGSPQTILVGFKDIFLAAHNFYIQVIYNSGLVFLWLFAAQLLHIFKIMKSNVSIYSLSFIMIPFMAITFFVSDFGVFFYFSLFLALNAAKTSIKDSVNLTPVVT
ncbi:hypothetical protein OAE48_00675 [Flavobacteriales bacterium]|nr:hypothetical protein [Flavobacteriales bacterium]